MMVKAIRTIGDYMTRRVVAHVARRIKADLDEALGPDEDGLVLELDLDALTDVPAIAVEPVTPRTRTRTTGKRTAKK